MSGTVLLSEAQMRACLRAAGDVISGTISGDDVNDHVAECADIEGAAYCHEMLDLTDRFIAFGRICGGRR